MTKLRTLIHLQDYLDSESGWRIKEIMDMKGAVKTSTALAQATLIRAGVTILYAHWEGFIKNAATGYVNYVQQQRCNYADLRSCFVVFGVKKRLNELVEAKRSKLNIEAVEFFLSEMQQRANLKIDSAIDTGANLSSSVFENIAMSIGIETRRYQPRYQLIDKSLLERRNHIAHGEYIGLEAGDYRSLADNILELLRWFKTDLENAATLSNYRRSTS